MSKRRNKNLKDLRKKLRKTRRRQIELEERLREKILTFDAPELYLKSKELKEGDDLVFINDMRDVLKVTKIGVGLAACQIGVNKRVCVLRFRPRDYSIITLINPVIIEKSSVNVVGEEGCLSFPGIVSKVKRPYKIKVKYLKEDFTESIAEFVSFEARVVCHEIDHFDGICAVGDKYKETNRSDIERQAGSTTV